MKKYSVQEKRSLALWAADCARHILPYFEKEYPKDDRPRKAIEVLRKWIRTGEFKMAEIRGASLAAHAAARKTKKNNAACFAARAAGQAVATAHVAQHAFGAAYYALKAVAVSDPINVEAKVAKEFKWFCQLADKRLSKNLRQEVLDRIIIEQRKKGIFIKINKGGDF